MKQYSDLDLIELIRQGESNAFQELYKRYWRPLYQKARQKVKAEPDAGDLVQDVFVSLWKGRASLHIRDSVGAYLFTVLKFGIFDYYARLNRLETFQAAQLRGITPGQNTTDETVLFHELQDFLHQEIENLPEGMKEVLLMSKEQHLSAEQIAGALSVSVQTVRNQLSMSLKKLRLSMARHYAEEVK